MSHRILPLAALVVLLLAIGSVIRTQPRHDKTEPPNPPPRAAFTGRVAATGLIEPVSENISLASHIPGVVESVKVRAGQPVKRGDVLVVLDTRGLRASLAERQGDRQVRKASTQTAKAKAGRARAAVEESRRQLGYAEAVFDKRGVSVEELTRRRSAVEVGDAELAAAQGDVAAAEASEVSAEAAVQAVETDLERSIVRSPIDGQVLQVRIRPGEFAPAGTPAQAWLIVGDTSTLHVRVDIDEHEGWRIRPEAAATAHPRGNASLQVPLKFVRIEPMMVPKQSLTGASTERVDTRVLQAIYRIESPPPFLVVGQQMDVFIEDTATK